MPLKSNSCFDSLLATTAMLNDDELRTLVNKCQSLIADRERIKREELRQELIENLQEAIGDVLHNGFSLTIKNIKRNPEYDNDDAVYFDTEDIYSIKIE